MNLKYVFFRIMALVVLFAVLIPIQATPTFGETTHEYIELSPDKGRIGDSIRVDGENFEASDYASGLIVSVNIYLSNQEADKGDVIDIDVTNYERVDVHEVDEDREFVTHFQVPARQTDGDELEEVHKGINYVYVTYADQDRIVAIGDFKVKNVPK